MPWPDDYFSVEEVEQRLHTATITYPQFIQKIPLLKETCDHRSCNAVKIAHGNDQGRVGVYIIGGVHAREAVPPDALINFIEQLAASYTNNTAITLGGKRFTAAQIKDIVDKLDVFVFPLVNPDGRHYSMTADSMWRSNRAPPQAGYNDCRGVNINRNYDFLWRFGDYFDPSVCDPAYEHHLTSSTNPCVSGDYIGPSVASEPETQNVTYIMDQFPQIRFFIDVHSYSELISYSWADDENQSADPNMSFRNPTYDRKRGVQSDTTYLEYANDHDVQLWAKLATRMRDAIQLVRNRTYKIGQKFNTLGYSESGDSTDYALSRCYVDPNKFKIHSFSIECGRSPSDYPYDEGFQPLDEKRQQIINEVIAGLLEFCLGVLELPPDIYIRDNLQDIGEEPLWGGGISCSPDINHFITPLHDPEAALGSDEAKRDDSLFDDIKAKQNNYIYVRVQNGGYTVGDVDIDVYWANPSTLPVPNSWLQNHIGALHATAVLPGEFRALGPLTWDEGDIPATGHYCFIAVIDATSDPKPDLNAIHTIDDFYALIRESNNVTWKNFDVKLAVRESLLQFDFWIQGWPQIAYNNDLELDCSALPKNIGVTLKLLRRLTKEATAEGLTKIKETKLYCHYDVTSSNRGILRDLSLGTSDKSKATITIMIPKDTPDGSYDFAVLQKIDGKEVGRVTKRLVVGEYPYVANRHTRELHNANCDWVKKMKPKNKLPYRVLEAALDEGYDGCHFCLAEYDQR